MEKRSQSAVIAVAAIAVVVAGVLLATFLNRGSDSGSLTGRTWQLASITGKTPAYQGVIPPAEQPLYTIAFATDGTFTARADCNSMSGTYVLGRSDGMTISPGPSTLVACAGWIVWQPLRTCPPGCNDMGDVRSGPDLDHVRRRDRYVRGLSDGARCHYTASLGGAESVPRPIPIRRAHSKRDSDPIANTHNRADNQPDGIPHSGGKRATDSGPHSRTDADAGIDYEADSRTIGDAHGDPGIDSEADAHPHPGPEHPSARWRPRRYELATRVVHNARPCRRGRRPGRREIEVHGLVRSGRDL